jgi:hypothetical protein
MYLHKVKQTCVDILVNFFTFTACFYNKRAFEQVIYS